MDTERTERSRASYLTAGVSYVLFDFSILLGLAWLYDGDPGSLVATGAPSLAYYVLIAGFGAVLVGLSLPRVERYWVLGSGVLLVALLASRFVLGPVTGVYSLVAVFALVFLPYVVALGILVRLVLVRLPHSRFRSLPRHPATVRGLLIAGVLLTGAVGGAVAAVAAAPPALPPDDWSTDRQLDYLERTDQGDRQTGAVVDRSRDHRRAERVLKLLQAGRADSPDDWLSAAIVLQHGSCAEHFEVAHRLATAANESPEVDATRWVHVTYDRWQVAMGNEQRYGTQIGTRRAGEACHPPIPSGLNVSNPLGPMS